MISRIGTKKRRNNLSGINIRAAGFTLIELILVIFFISVITGLSAPLFKRTFSDLQLKSTSFGLIKTIDYAQEMAIVERTSYRMSFDFKEGKFWLMKSDVAGNKAEYKKIGGRYGRIFSVPPGLAINGKKPEIIFYPDGRSDTAEIEITDKKNMEGLRLKVKGFGTRVEITEIKNG